MTHSVESLATSRRDLFKVAVAGTLAAAGGLDLLAGGPHAARAQTPGTPQEALKELMDGNTRFVNGQMISFEEDLKLIKQHTEHSQQPFAGVLACADSRVPVEIVFDQTIGKLFVTRVAGNIATPEIIASLEYGAAVLKTKVIMALGHASCGAVDAAIGGKAAPGQISALYAPLRRAIDQAGPSVDAAVRANAIIQARLLRQSSPVLADLVKKGDLLVVAAYYDLATGRVTLLS
jgi:carbonic anhydrase